MERVIVVFVGSNPSKSAHSRVPFDLTSRSGKTLRQWLKVLDLDGHIQGQRLYNVANRPTPNNRPLNAKEIVAALPALHSDLEYEQMMDRTIGLRVVALGKTAEKALTLLRVPFYSMPHPSGMNRQLNDPKYVEEKINGLREYLSPSNISANFVSKD